MPPRAGRGALLRSDGGFGFRWTDHAAPTVGEVLPSTVHPAN